MSTHPPPLNANKDLYALYGSPIGPRILKQANTIFETFPVSKYVLFFFVFMLEVAAVIYIGLKLVK